MQVDLNDFKNQNLKVKCNNYTIHFVKTSNLQVIYLTFGMEITFNMDMIWENINEKNIYMIIF